MGSFQDGTARRPPRKGSEFALRPGWVSRLSRDQSASSRLPAGRTFGVVSSGRSPLPTRPEIAESGPPEISGRLSCRGTKWNDMGDAWPSILEPPLGEHGGSAERRHRGNRSSRQCHSWRQAAVPPSDRGRPDPNCQDNPAPRAHGRTGGLDEQQAIPAGVGVEVCTSESSSLRRPSRATGGHDPGDCVYLGARRCCR